MKYLRFNESNNLFSLKGVALNTAGLEDKLRYGILDQSLISKDIAIIVESNTDHPCLQSMFRIEGPWRKKPCFCWL